MQGYNIISHIYGGYHHEKDSHSSLAHPDAQPVGRLRQRLVLQRRGQCEAGRAQNIEVQGHRRPIQRYADEGDQADHGEKGYTIEIIEFGDYVQPNLALSNGDLAANLFQHKIYMDNFAKENKLELTDLIVVPTAPMGIYSSKYKALGEIADGSTVALANDPTNLARSLGLLQDAGLLTMKDDIDPLRVSEKDVKDNPKQLVLQPIEAGQLPRAVDSADISSYRATSRSRPR